MVDPATFRDVMAQWPSGVTVVTMLTEDGTWHGMTASSFSSVSLDPPLVSICLSKTLFSHSLIEKAGVFGVNVLAKDQIDVGRRFAGMEGVEDRFSGETWTTAETGVPLLDSALGWVDCRLVHAHEGGDHTIFVGEVVAGHAARRSAPLLFHSRGWGQFADVLPDVATLADTGLVAALAARGRADDVERVAGELSGAGVRVRVADLTTPGAELSLPAGLSPDLVSVVVAEVDQAPPLVAEGIGAVEFVLDPADRRQVERVVQGLLAAPEVAARSAVHLVDPFAVDRLDDVLDAVQLLNGATVAEIGLLDTEGRATPLRVRALLQEAVALARPIPLRMSLHDRDRLGLVKAITALKSGVRHFSSTLGGGDGAVATEHLIRLLEEVDVATPVDTAALAGLAAELREAPSAQPVRPHSTGALR